MQNYATALHNVNDSGTPELFYPTLEQMNLLSHIWTYTRMTEGEAVLQETLANL